MSRLVARGLVALLAASLTGCGAIARFAPAPTPQPCDQVFAAGRCDLIVDVVAEQVGVEREEIVAIRIVPEPTPETQLDGTVILQTRSGGPPLVVEAVLPDGTVRTATMCGGSLPPSSPCAWTSPGSSRCR